MHAVSAGSQTTTSALQPPKADQPPEALRPPEVLHEPLPRAVHQAARQAPPQCQHARIIQAIGRISLELCAWIMNSINGALQMDNQVAAGMYLPMVNSNRTLLLTPLNHWIPLFNYSTLQSSAASVVVDRGLTFVQSVNGRPGQNAQNPVAVGREDALGQSPRVAWLVRL